MKRVYLDSAATTLIKPDAVSREVFHALKNLASPGRGGYASSMAAAETVFRCREAAARLFHVGDPESVVFTMNATHALNIAIHTLASSGSRVVVSGYEHNSVLRPLKERGCEVITAASPPFDRGAAISAFAERLSDGADLVVVNHVSNVFGSVLPVAEIAEMCRSAKIPLIVDASQSAGALEVDFTRLNADFIAMPGHKGLYGPQGTGLLLCRYPPKSPIQGGTGSASSEPKMPDFLPDAAEAGTLNTPGIAGLAAGIGFVLKKGVSVIGAHERELIRRAADGLETIPNVRVFRSRVDGEQAGALSFIVDGRDVSEIGDRLDRRGISVRTGLHCAYLAHKTAGTLNTGTVRVSVSAFTTKSDIDYFLTVMEETAR